MNDSEMSPAYHPSVNEKIHFAKSLIFCSAAEMAVAHEAVALVETDVVGKDQH